jgi:transcriptional regulator with XRE-family HTH domain
MFYPLKTWQKSSKNAKTVIFVIMENGIGMPKTIHHGKNVKRIREILGVKQEGLAASLGEDWNQRKISVLEDKEVIEQTLLEQVAEALKVPVEAIKNFSEEATINIIANTFQDESSAYTYNYKCVFNPFDKWVETVDKNEKLYEALLKSEREKVAMLEKMLKERK